MTEQLNKLKEAISQELEFCNADVTPNICAMISTVAGKTKIVDLVCEYVGNNGMSISEALVEIERERSTSFDQIA